MRRLSLAAAGLLVALTIAACSSASGAQPGGPSSPPASVDPNAVVVQARDVAFVQSEIDVPAGKAFTLVFDNSADKYPHNVAIDDASGASQFRGEIIDGGKTVTYQVPALAAGTYTFKCDVHPNMKGTVVAK